MLPNFNVSSCGVLAHRVVLVDASMRSQVVATVQMDVKQKRLYERTNVANG